MNNNTTTAIAPAPYHPNNPSPQLDLGNTAAALGLIDAEFLARYNDGTDWFRKALAVQYICATNDDNIDEGDDMGISENVSALLVEVTPDEVNFIANYYIPIMAMNLGLFFLATRVTDLEG